MGLWTSWCHPLGLFQTSDANFLNVKHWAQIFPPSRYWSFNLHWLYVSIIMIVFHFIYTHCIRPPYMLSESPLNRSIWLESQNLSFSAENVAIPYAQELSSVSLTLGSETDVLRSSAISLTDTSGIRTVQQVGVRDLKQCQGMTLTCTQSHKPASECFWSCWSTLEVLQGLPSCITFTLT